jgi:DNA-binding MarR family transcriptional regulator
MLNNRSNEKQQTETGRAAPQSNVIESAARDLFSIPPLIARSVRRKVTNLPTGDLPPGISPVHIHTLKTLLEQGPLHINTIGQQLLIKSPHMTHLVDTLVNRSMVDRQTDPEDRRSINLILTQKGRQFLEDHEKNIMEGIRAFLGSLSAKELQDLSTSLRNVRDTLLKL